MFQPNPSTKADVNEDGRRTREGVEHVSGQVAAEGKVNQAEHHTTQRLIVAPLPEKVEIAAAQNILTDEEKQRIFDAVAPRLGAEQAQRSVDQVEAVVEEGDAAIAGFIASGDFAAAATRQREIAEQGDRKQADAWRNTARLSVLTSVEQAIRDYARATDLDPTDFWTWIELSRLHRAAGSLPAVRQAAEAALQHVADDWDRMVAENELGDIAVVEGDLDTAARHFQSGLLAAQAVLAIEPESLARQRDLSVSHERLGNVAVARGDLDGAERAYSDDLTIAERLAAGDPGNAAWQRDLSVSHNKLGDVAVARGDLDGAERAYRDGLTIRERLAAGDAGNAEWQRDLVVSHFKLAQVAETGGDLARAIGEFRLAESTLVALLARVGVHPQFERDLQTVRGQIARLGG